eukprot:scaffold21676_cov60-Phaeocystis_antarctica.AAC.8
MRRARGIPTWSVGSKAGTPRASPPAPALPPTTEWRATARPAAAAAAAATAATAATAEHRAREHVWSAEYSLKLRHGTAFWCPAHTIDGHLPWRRRPTPSLLRPRDVRGRIQGASHQAWWDACDDARALHVV